MPEYIQVTTTSDQKEILQSLAKNLIHLVYSTKNRKPWISKHIQDDLFAYQAGIFDAWESPVLSFEVFFDGPVEEGTDPGEGL